MTFVSVPNTGQSLGGTRDQIRTNMDDLRNQSAVNHVDVNITGSGKHKFLQMPEQTVFPVTPVDEGQLLAREYNSKTELAWRPENVGLAGDQYILSGMPIRAAARFNGDGANGVKPLTGLSFNISSVTKVSSQTFDVLFLTQFPIAAPTGNYLVLANRFNRDSISIINITSTGFTLSTASVAPIDICFIVLGG